MNKKNITIKLPKDFFSRLENVPKKTWPDPPEDMIPFKWSKEVLSGKYKGKVIITVPKDQILNYLVFFYMYKFIVLGKNNIGEYNERQI